MSSRAAVVGDGIGEVAAGCTAGVFSVEDAVALVVAQESSARSPLRRWRKQLRQLFIVSRGFRSDLARQVRSRLLRTSPARDWTHQARDPRAFDVCVHRVLAAGQCVLLEVGPAASIQRFESANSEHRVSVSSLCQGGEATTDVMTALAVLYTTGVDVNWDARLPGSTPGSLGSADVSVRDEPVPARSCDSQRGAGGSGKPVVARGRCYGSPGGPGPLDLQLDTYEARWNTFDRVTVEH